MKTRVHILVDEADKARYREQAEREGKSLGAWLRDAAEARLRDARESSSLRTRTALEDFFAACDERERDREPDWADHLSVIERSRIRGVEIT